jgi:hypothetical protein
VSLIGTLEQFTLASILQRLEVHAKTGLLTIKQGVQWVEFYFWEGRLVCIGPMRTTPTLGERLVQDGVITTRTLQDTLRSLETTQPSETRLALALMDLGHVSRDDLRTWAARKATEVLQILLMWSSGEVHFEEGAAPPSDRLLVALSVTTLLDAVQTTTIDSPTPSASGPAQDQPAKNSVATPSPDPARITTLIGTEQFSSESAIRTSSPDPIPEAPAAPPAPASIRASALISLSPDSSLPATESLLPQPPESQAAMLSASPSLASLPATESLPPFLSITGENEPMSQPLAQPVPVMNPVPPRRIDTSFMRPEMVLMPANLAALRAHNPMMQITPQQWQVLTQVDGRTSLQAIAQALGVLPEMLLQVVGELVAAGLIQVVLPGQMPTDITVSPPGAMNSGFYQGYITPGYAAATTSPWAPAPSALETLPFAAQPYGDYSAPAGYGPGAPAQPGRAQAPYSNAYAQAGGSTR